MPLLLVRHADAGDRSPADDDHLRPLTRHGRAQSAALVALLAPYAPTRILTSPFARCVETVAPLGAHLGRRVEPVPALAEGADDEAVRLVDDLAGDDVVLCTHGDVVPTVLGALSRRGLPLPVPARWEKASTWILTHAGGTWSSATYLPPPAGGGGRAARR